MMDLSIFKNLSNCIAEYAYHTSLLDGYTAQEAEEQTREALKTDPCAVRCFLQDSAADGTTYHTPIHDGGLWKDAPDGVWVDPDGSKHTAYIPKQIRGTCDYAACETYSGMLRKIKREYSEYAEYNKFISKH